VSGENNSVNETVEAMFPETTQEFKRIQDEQYDLFCKKQFDYGPGNISVGTTLKTKDEVQFSLFGLWFRKNDKVQRLKNILITKKEPQNESIEDSYLDVGNYSIISLLVQRGKWGR
jgi:hypothetical protein